jgi:DnaK suppressor protein
MADSELDLEFFRRKLISLRDELEALQSTIDEAAQTVELDQARVGRLSRMDALQAQSMSIEVKRRQELQLRRVSAALRRIDGDDFGVCQDCGQEIHPERLAFDPAAILCIACAEIKER